MPSPYIGGGAAPSFGPPAGLASIMAGQQTGRAADRAGSRKNITTIMEFLQKAGDQKKKDATEATTLEKLFDIYDPDGKEDRKINPLSLDQYRAGVKGFVLEQDMAEKKQKLTAELATADATTKYRNALATALEREGQQDSTLAAALKAATQIETPASEDTGPAFTANVPFNEQRLRDALAQGGGGGREGLRFLMEGDEAGGPIAFEEDPESGVRFARHRNSILASGVNRERAGTAVEIKTSTGESLGLGLPGRSGVTPLQTGQVNDKDKYNRLTKQLTGLIAAQGKTFLQQSRDEYQKQIAHVEQQIQELEGDGAPASGPAATGRVTTQAQFDALASGTVYTGNDGKQYRKP